MNNKLVELGNKIKDIYLGPLGVKVDTIELQNDTVVLSSFGPITELYFGRLSSSSVPPGAWEYTSDDLNLTTPCDNPKPDWAVYLIGRGFRLNS